ncbi:MAG TPA: ATP-dependent DNA helicase RecQ [Bryobacteraceae bacterium]
MPVKRSVSGAGRSILQAARENFGFDDLRLGQEAAIRSLLAKRDTLVVMPTGSGKSAIYQVAGIMRRGPVLVVSPLIALQKDQVDSIQASKGNARALVINSTLPFSELRDALERVARRKFKFIFLAPEQLVKEEVFNALKEARLAFVVIDEAHCISQWGHDFRPDYLELGRVIDALGHPVTLALTATASSEVREEIVQRLGMNKPRILTASFDRPNIYLRVDRFEQENKKLEAVIHQVRWATKPGIVYVGTRKTAEQIMASLAEEGISSVFYHGGLKASERHQVQDEFMSGRAGVIVATNAFGMGIDKADIRFVYHHDVPDSLDAYYQEIGRGGRDGERSEAILFFRKEDIGAQAFHTGSGKTSEDELGTVADALSAGSRALKISEIAERTDLTVRRVQMLIQKLQDTETVQVLSSGKLKLRRNADLHRAAELVAASDEERQRGNKERLEQMRDYAEATGCRRELLLRYFGEEFHGPCHNCDNCEAQNPEATLDPSVGTRREVA